VGGEDIRKTKRSEEERRGNQGTGITLVDVYGRGGQLISRRSTPGGRNLPRGSKKKARGIEK